MWDEHEYHTKLVNLRVYVLHITARLTHDGPEPRVRARRAMPPEHESGGNAATRHLARGQRHALHQCKTYRVTITSPGSAVTFQDAANHYRIGIGHAHNVVQAHRASGGPKAGPRFTEVSLNRAIVLMAIASWQALVEDLVYASFPYTSGASNTGRISKYQHEVKAFSTPDADRTRRLISANLNGFDVFPHWTWSSHGGQGLGYIETPPHEAAARLQAWMRIRHAVAHGARDLYTRFSEPFAVERTDGVEEQYPDIRGFASKNYRQGGRATLSLTDARQCLTFINNLAHVTGTALTSHFGAAPVVWRQRGGVDGVW